MSTLGKRRALEFGGDVEVAPYAKATDDTGWGKVCDNLRYKKLLVDSKQHVGFGKLDSEGKPLPNSDLFDKAKLADEMGVGKDDRCWHYALARNPNHRMGCCSDPEEHGGDDSEFHKFDQDFLDRIQSKLADNAKLREASYGSKSRGRGKGGQGRGKGRGRGR